jgi:hypothetical protein
VKNPKKKTQPKVTKQKTQQTVTKKATNKHKGKEIEEKINRNKNGTSTIYMIFVFLRVIQKNSVGT